MDNYETKRIGPDRAEVVFTQVRDAILDRWQVYAQVGIIHLHCESVERIYVDMVRPKQPTSGQCLLPLTELDRSREV